jgi:hypothetical protein
MSLRSAEGLSPPLADEIYPTRAQAPEHHITSVSVVFNPTKLHGNPMGKKYELAKLVALRRSETHPRYLSLSHYEDGFYDLDFVVPWTAGAKNVDAALMIIGQDWISEDYLKRNSLPEKRLARREAGQDAGLATNRNLKKLLANAFGLLFSDTYATNVSVFIKPGNMDANVPMRDLEHFAKKFTLPQIRIVKPRMVLCLGERTFNAVRRAAGYTDLKLSEAYTPLPHIRAASMATRSWEITEHALFNRIITLQG